MNRNFALAAVAAFALSACSGLKDAFSAHTDVAARAGSAELSATRMAEVIGKSRAPLRKDVAKAVANLWVDYQLLAEAALHGDSLNDSKAIDEAMWPSIANLKARKWYDQLSKTWGTEDPAAAQAQYASGQILSAQHILLLTPQGMSDADKAIVRKKAEALRKQVNPANFAALATANSQDPGSAKAGGSLGLFAKGAMVKEFEAALLALKPGDISPVITTQYGYHIIRRPAFEEQKTQLLQASKGRSLQAAEAAYLAKVEANGDINVKSGALATLRAIGTDGEMYRKDNTVLATSRAGKFTAARMVGWLETFPPQARVFEQLKSAPDSLLTSFLRNLVKNELVLRQADSAKVEVDPAQIADMRRGFAEAVQRDMQQLGIAPKLLADSAKTDKERAALASRRIDDYFTKLVSDQAAFIQIPAPVSSVLRTKYSYSVNDTGVDRALQLAAKIRAGTDSTRGTEQPPSAVPLGPNAPATSSTAPAPAR